MMTHHIFRLQQVHQLLRRFVQQNRLQKVLGILRKLLAGRRLVARLQRPRIITPIPIDRLLNGLLRNGQRRLMTQRNAQQLDAGPKVSTDPRMPQVDGEYCLQFRINFGGCRRVQEDCASDQSEAGDCASDERRIRFVGRVGFGEATSNALENGRPILGVVFLAVFVLKKNNE